MSQEISATDDGRRREHAAVVDKCSSGDGVHATAIGGLFCIRLTAPNMKLPSVYQPSICVIVQGAKRVLLEDEIYHYAPPQFLAVSVDLPLLGQVVEASAQRPYLCLQIVIEPRQIGELIAQSDDARWSRSDTARGLFVGTLDDPTQDAVLRLARLLETPRDIPVLAYRVGYQSASQFSREYARMFGAPPIRDIEGIRNPTALGA